MRHGSKPGRGCNSTATINPQLDTAGGETISASFEADDPKDGSVLLVCPRQIQYARWIRKQALEDYSLSRLRPSHLGLIIRLNVLNAVAENATLIGVSPDQLCRDEFVSPFGEPKPLLPLAPAIPPPECPSSLKPTQVQRTIPHHPWIDLFPFPNFRDAALVRIQAGLFDEDELCFDLLGIECAGPNDKPALLVWTQAWDPRGWEVSEAFLRKWGMLVESSPEILVSTNYWRMRRGQIPLLE